MFVKSFPVGMIGTNCYLLGDESTKAMAIIDPGDDGAHIKNQIDATGYQVRMILLTHGHFDHVTAVPELLHSYPGIPVYICQADYAEAIGENRYTEGIGEIPTVQFYDEGDTIQLGELPIHILRTPGHTPGSVTLMVDNALFTGDTLFCGSCGRTDFPGGSHQQMLQSLKRLAKLDGDYAVYPGHESFSTLNNERARNFFIAEAMRLPD